MLRALKSGKISGTRDEAGAWHVDASELHRVFAPVASAQALPEAMPQHAHTDALIRQLEAALCDMRQQRADAMADRDKWREAFENQQRLALPMPRQEPQPAQADDADAATPWRRFLRWRKAAG